ncbi:MAG: hypothetical protein HF982_13765 [Desulfobacteraceae bacterium]|nr:hypothetical protein [Desulfobacteraceae bacterium]MBC2720626.1 hypothetical protein [Desulfobacteraceae bacterium]
MGKNKKKDIFDDLLKGAEEDSIPGIKDLTELLYSRGQPSTEASTKKIVRASQQKRKEKTTAKKKVTYYIPEKISVELSEAKAKIKVMVPSELKSRVSMSKIVELALNSIFNELETKGQKSSLVKNILRKCQKN